MELLLKNLISLILILGIPLIYYIHKNQDIGIKYNDDVNKVEWKEG